MIRGYIILEHNGYYYYLHSNDNSNIEVLGRNVINILKYIKDRNIKLDNDTIIKRYLFYMLTGVVSDENVYSHIGYPQIFVYNEYKPVAKCIEYTYHINLSNNTLEITKRDGLSMGISYNIDEIIQRSVEDMIDEIIEDTE